MMDLTDTCPALDEAGAALAALGEDVVLLAFYRGGAGGGGDRYSIRLSMDGEPSGIQESAATASTAFSRAMAARARRRESQSAEAALRAEIARRMAAERD